MREGTLVGLRKSTVRRVRLGSFNPATERDALRRSTMDCSAKTAKVRQPVRHAGAEAHRSRAADGAWDRGRRLGRDRSKFGSIHTMLARGRSLNPRCENSIFRLQK